LRPEKTLEEGKTKDLFYASVLDKDVTSCKNCGTSARVEYKFCPKCSHHLQERCPHCGITVNPTWKFCANCQTYLLPLPWYKRLPRLRTLPERMTLNLPLHRRIEIQLPSWNLKRIKVNLEQLRKFTNKRPASVKTVAVQKESHEVSRRSRQEVLPMPTLTLV